MRRQLLVWLLAAALCVATVVDADARGRVVRRRAAAVRNLKKFGPLRPADRVAECVSRGGECHAEEEGCIVDGRIEWTSAGHSVPNEWRLEGLCAQKGELAGMNLKCCVNQYETDYAAVAGFRDLLHESRLTDEDILMNAAQEGVPCENCVRLQRVTKLTMTGLVHLRLVSRCPLAVVGGTEREGLSEGFGLELAADLCLSQWILTHTAQDPYHVTTRYDDSGTTYEMLENTRWRVVFARLPVGPAPDQIYGQHGPHIDLQRPIKPDKMFPELIG